MEERNTNLKVGDDVVVVVAWSSRERTNGKKWQPKDRRVGEKWYVLIPKKGKKKGKREKNHENEKKKNLNRASLNNFLLDVEWTVESAKGRVVRASFFHFCSSMWR
jgi:hypothetical protein